MTGIGKARVATKTTVWFESKGSTTVVHQMEVG
jgi:hypothetical protein